MAEGYKNFANGAILGETDLDDYLMSQTAMRFADAAARNTALSAVLTEGLVAYLKDVNQLTMYNGTAWVIVGTIGAQTAGTSILVQNTTPTISVARSTYDRQGEQIQGSFEIICTAGTAGTAANEVRITVPVTPFTGASVNTIAGVGFIYDNSAGVKYRGFLVFANSSQFKLLTLHSTTDGYLGVTDFTAALATDDVVAGNFSYAAGSPSA